MSIFRRSSKMISVLATISLLALAIAPANAGMINNQTLLAETQHQLSVQTVLNDLNRQDIQERLTKMGVDPEVAKVRVSQLSEEELSQLHQNFEQIPAGSGIIGIALSVFIVLVITDMLGATDVFSFVHNINH